jgi:aspartate racemase
MNKPPSPQSPFRVGILGGMGPLAGIELHRLIVDATPANKDQDHLQIVLFTNPRIPDRTQSLRDDNGELFAQAAGESVAELERMDVDVMVMACMTAHSRLQYIQSQTRTPILNAIPLVHTALIAHYPKKKVALLATPGSINAGIYTNGSTNIDWLIPGAQTQQQVTDAIYKIKAGQILYGSRQLLKAMAALQEQGADVFILGCTELGLLFADLQERDYSVIDPMRLMAQQLVILDSLHRSVLNSTGQQTKPVYNKSS